jgi:thioredoxin 1
MANLPEVTDATFENEVLKATRPTLVDFWAAWCGPCLLVAPVVEEVAQEYGDRMRVVRMDVDTNPNTPHSFGIMGIPTLILFKDGAEATRVVGYRPKEALVEELIPHLEALDAEASM